jgi:NAD-dependent deacetylase
MSKKKIVVLTGAGISQESGLKTFRGEDGLWEGHSIYDVATPESWSKDPRLVQKFYNERRKGVLAAKPNKAHLALVELELKYEVSIITQNIDDLHERAGSTNIVHLHGLITKSQSSINPDLTYDILGDTINKGQLCELGSQLRPHVVWFGEAVPMMEVAAKLVIETDYLIVIGTSLQVYPAAGLVNYTNKGCEIIVIDPKAVDLIKSPKALSIPKKAQEGTLELVKQLLANS